MMDCFYQVCVSLDRNMRTGLVLQLDTTLDVGHDTVPWATANQHELRIAAQTELQQLQSTV